MIQQRTSSGAGGLATAGLRTFPRLSTGVERVLVVIGGVAGVDRNTEVSKDVLAISLQRPGCRSVCRYMGQLRGLK
jgi:hypothetical protein